MNFVYAVIVPKNTPKSAPFIQYLRLSWGVITHVQIVIPSGHWGLAHLTMLIHEFQLYPLSRGEDYHGDDVVIPFADRFFIETQPFELKVVAWNTDTEEDHEFLLSFEMMLPDQLGIGVGAQGLRDIQTLTGATLEV